MYCFIQLPYLQLIKIYSKGKRKCFKCTFVILVCAFIG